MIARFILKISALREAHDTPKNRNGGHEQSKQKKRWKIQKKSGEAPITAKFQRVINI